MTDASVDCLDIEAVIDLIKGIPKAAAVEAQIWIFLHANSGHGFSGSVQKPVRAFRIDSRCM